MRHADDVGLAPHQPVIDFGRVMAHVERAIRTIEPQDSPERLRRGGVDVIEAEGRFDGPGVIHAGGRFAAPSVAPFAPLRCKRRHGPGAYERVEVVFDTGLTLFTYTADPGTRSAAALSLLGSLAAITGAERASAAP